MLLLMLDCNEWPVAFLGALYAGVVPVAVNTLLTVDDYAYMLAHSRRPGGDRLGGARADAAQGDGRGAERGRPRDRRRRRDRSSRRRFDRFRFARRTGQAARRAGRDARRRPGLLALLVGLDRQAEGHGAHARQPLVDGRALRQGRARPDRERRLLLGRQALLRLRPRQRADLPALGRRERRADGRAADARRGLQALDRRAPRRRRRHDLRPTVFFGAPTGFAGMLASPALPAQRRGRLAHVLVGRRGAAGRDRPALRAPLRLRHRRRHRLDRDAARLPLQPARRHPLRHDRQAGRGLRDRAARRGRPAGRRRRGRRSLHQGAERGADVLGQPREVARDLPGRLDQERRQVRARRRRLLHLRRPQRRHAEGERHLGLAVRGRGDADAAPGGARVRGDRHRGRRGPDQDQGLRRRQAGRRGERRRAQGLRQGKARRLQVPARDRVRRRAAEDGDRQDPALSPARARARRPPRRERAGRRPRASRGSTGAAAPSRSSTNGSARRAAPRRSSSSCTRASARSRCGRTSRASSARRTASPASSSRATATAARPPSRATSAGRPTSCTARPTRCCPRSSRTSASSGPGSSATATAPRSRCCMRRAIRSAGVVAVAPHLFVEDVSIASIEKARDAYESTDLRARLAPPPRRPRLGVSRLERRLALARVPRLEHRGARSRRSPARCSPCRARTTSTARSRRSTPSPSMPKLADDAIAAHRQTNAKFSSRSAPLAIAFVNAGVAQRRVLQLERDHVGRDRERAHSSQAAARAARQARTRADCSVEVRVEAVVGGRVGHRAVRRLAVPDLVHAPCACTVVTQAAVRVGAYDAAVADHAGAERRSRLFAGSYAHCCGIEDEAEVLAADHVARAHRLARSSAAAAPSSARRRRGRAGRRSADRARW